MQVEIQEAPGLVQVGQQGDGGCQAADQGGQERTP